MNPPEVQVSCDICEGDRFLAFLHADGIRIECSWCGATMKFATTIGVPS